MKPSISVKLQSRYDAITHQLADHRIEPLSTTDLWHQLGGVTHTTLRTLQRDLVELETRELIARKDGGWVIGETLDDDMFDSFAAAVALEVMLESLDWAIPADTLDQLAKPLRRFKNRLKGTFDDHPRLRWLKALEIQKPYHPYDRPIISPEVREVVERSIQDRTKIHLAFRHRGELHTSVVSISKYLLRLPDEPRIRVWPDGSDKALHIALENIESAERLVERATWPMPRKADEERKSAPSVIEVRISPELRGYWQKKEIGRWLDVVSVDAEGWAICRFEGRTTKDVIRYLIGFGRQVEVRKPYSLRMFVENEVRTATKMYDASRAEAALWCEEEIQAALVGQMGETG